MGGLKKPKISSAPTATGEKGKEIKIVTKQAITIGDIMKNPRILKVLYLISMAENGISEKALIHLVYTIEKELGLKLGYNYVTIGGIPVSRDLSNDLTSLKYTGLVELSLKNKKLYITGQGKEVLEKSMDQIKEEAEDLRKAFTEAWPKIAPIDLEASLKTTKR